MIPVFDHDLLRLRRARATAEAGFLFREVAVRLMERMDVVRKEFPRVLDLGCADGTLTRLISARRGTQEVVAADISPPAAVACTAETLPFAPGSFDAVASCLHLHWANDLPGALAQVRQALKPDGMFLAALAGGETLTELRQCLMEAEMQEMGGASPRVSPFAALGDMGALMQRAGFALPVVDGDRITVDYPDMFSLMRDLRGMGAANAALNRLRRPTRRAVFMTAAEIYRGKFGDGAGRVPATFDIIHVIGWVPHAAQQQPQARGSAKVRLAEILRRA